MGKPGLPFSSPSAPFERMNPFVSLSTGHRLERPVGFRAGKSAYLKPAFLLTFRPRFAEEVRIVLLVE